MAKDLKSILAGKKSSKEQNMDLSDWEKSKDGQAFAAGHKIEKHGDRAGNEDHAYDSGKVKQTDMKKHGYKSPSDQKVYESKMTCESCGKMYEGESCGCSGKAVPEAKPGKRGMIADKKKLDEVLTKKTSAGEVISDFVHSKNPKFAGKTTKERQRMALGAYYGMHPEKKKINEEPDFEYEMARNELETASRAIERLMKHLKGEGNLEAWVQSKLLRVLII